MTDLSKHQPLYYKKSEVMQAINSAFEAELERLKEAAEKITAESNALTTVDRIAAWERSVGLNENSDFPLEQRRSRVVARLRQIGATTKARIKAIAESYARGSVEIIEYSSEYKVVIKFIDRIGKPDNMTGLIEQLKRIIPAHIEVGFEYKYRTWQQVLDTGKTWGQLKDSGYTWNDILSKEAL